MAVVGKNPNQIPLNQHLGKLAFQDELPYVGSNATTPTVASASTITISKKVTFVSGTTTISTINVPNSRFIGSTEITIIPTGLWATNTSGNIASVITAVSLVPIKLTYDNTLNKWYALTSGGSGGGSTLTIDSKTAAYTVVAGDLGKVINCTLGVFTISLTAAATLGAGFNVTIWNTSSTATDTITIDPSGTETIDGSATWKLYPSEGMQIICDGTNWISGAGKNIQYFAECALPGGYINDVQANAGGAIALGPRATALAIRATAIGYTTGATSTNSTALGVNSANSGSQTATGSGAMALGGSYASGADSFAAAIADNTSTYGAQGTNSTAIGKLAKATGNAGSIAIGYGAIASGAGSASVGYQNNAGGGGNGCFIFGNQCTSTGTNSFSIGTLCTSSNANSYAAGYYSNAAINGKYAYSGGTFGTVGDAQFGKLVIRAATTTTTAVVLTSDGGAASTTNQLVVASGQAMAIQGTLIGKQASSGNMVAYNITGAVSNNSGTMASTGLALTIIGTDSIGLGAAPTITVDSTNKAVQITSGYKSATNIRWVATLNTSEVTYA